MLNSTTNNSNGAINATVGGGIDRRRGKRVAFAAAVGVAPFDGDHLPKHGEFTEADSRDLSPTGISFYTEKQIDTEWLVLKLGEAPSAIYVTAKVVRNDQGFFQRKRQFLVACAFTGRVTLPLT